MNIKSILSFSDRIKAIIKLVGSAEKLANNSGMSGRVIGQYLAGKTDPTRKKLIALAEAACVNIEWLTTGVGPMRKGEYERFPSILLAIIVEGLDNLETTVEKKLTPIEKAEIISEVYNIVSEDNYMSEKEKIWDTIKAVYNFYSSLNIIIETEKDREQAIKKMTSRFENILSKKETERDAHDLFELRLLRLRLRVILSPNILK